MKDGCVTLDEVFAAASARAASLVPETSGYLALAVGDATSRLPLAHDDRALLLTTEGSLSLSRRGDVVAPEAAAKAMRDMLARLLAVSAGTMPGLAAAARPREESSRGVDAVIEEIEAALIPVNRAAARRALGRLARETLRAKEAGKRSSKREASVRPPPPPPRAPVAVVAIEIENEPSARAVFSEPPPFAPKTETPVPAAEVFVPDEETLIRADQALVTAALTPILVALTPIPVALTPIPVALTPIPTARMESVEAETVIPDEQIVVAHAEVFCPTPFVTPSPSPLCFERARPGEPTPTTLGMAIEIDEAQTPFSAMETVHATALGKAFFVEEHASVVIHASVIEMPVIPAPGLEPLPKPTTRADDLLATFAVSCSDEAAVREATDCLKRLAGLEPTPPPLVVAPPAPKRIARATTPQAPVVAAPRAARADLAPVPAPKAVPALDALSDELEEEGRAPRKRSRPGLSLVAALLAGAVVGLVAVLRFRPDLVDSFEERVSPTLGSERTAAPAARAR